MKLHSIIAIFILSGFIHFMEAKDYRIFTNRGKEISIEDLAAESEKYDVIFMGETHDDPVAHSLEEQLFKILYEKSMISKRPVSLSLEMFEQDSQLRLNEYLADLIREKDFLQSSKPWSNYRDYRPLIEFAKEKKIAVIAANAPAPYVNRASRLGISSLNDLSETAKTFLPPLPIMQASPAYMKRFEDQMKSMPHHDKNFNILEGQSLRDAGMAYFISLHLLQKPFHQILHVAGKFHSEMNLGIPEHLRYYRPGTKSLIVTILSEEGYPEFQKSHEVYGDIIILTDPGIPRSFTPDFMKQK